MNKMIKTIAIAATLSAASAFAASDYVIQLTEKDGTVRNIPVSTLEKISFETATTTIEVDNPQKAFEERFGDEKISATQYKVNGKVAEMMLRDYHAKTVNHKHRI